LWLFKTADPRHFQLIKRMSNLDHRTSSQA
jgi:hypothetical protein